MSDNLQDYLLDILIFVLGFAAVILAVNFASLLLGAL